VTDSNTVNGESGEIWTQRMGMVEGVLNWGI